MVRLVFVAIEGECGVQLAAMRLIIMVMIHAADAFFGEGIYHIGMIANAAGFIPNGIAVKIADKQGAFALDELFIILQRFPYLAYVLLRGFLRVVGPYREKRNVPRPGSPA